MYWRDCSNENRKDKREERRWQMLSCHSQKMRKARVFIWHVESEDHVRACERKARNVALTWQCTYVRVGFRIIKYEILHSIPSEATDF